METQENQNKKNKKQQGIDWENVAWQFGTIALQGVIGGMATAFGANMASKALNGRSGKSAVSSGDNVVKFSKTGTV
jgi:hypothetical protein